MMHKRLFIVLIFALFIIASFGFGGNFFESAGHDALAQKIIATCSDVEYRPLCYDLEIPKLMDRGLSMEEAFLVTKIIQGRDNEYSYCHILGHYLSAKETAKDPSRWKDVVARAPSGVCSNGAIHGAFQERFRAESLPDAAIEDLKAELAGICDKRKNWDPTGLEKASCTHGLGHLTMYVTAANIKKSLEICDEIAFDKEGHDMRHLCYDGAFMQLYQPLDPEDFALISGKEIKTQEAAQSFCNQFSGSYRGSCVRESWPLFRDEIQKPEGLVRHCSALQGILNEEYRCYAGLTNVLMAMSGLDEGWAGRFCPNLPDDWQGECFAFAASRAMEVDWRNTDKAVNICAFAEQYGVAQECYEQLIQQSTYNLKPGSDEFYNLCEALPGVLKGICLKQHAE